MVTWVREGLIDNLIAYPWRNLEVDVDYFGPLVRGTEVAYYAEMMPRRMPPKEYRRKAIRSYEAGATGLCLWDTNPRFWYRRERSMASRFGHRDELPAWTDGEDELFRTVKLRAV